MNSSANAKGIYYGYIVVAAIFIFMIIAFGVNYNFGVFFDPIQNEFGWNRGTVSGAYALLTVVSGFLGILAGRLADKKGPFVVVLIITVTLGCGYMLMSTCRSLSAFYLYHGLILAIGVGAGWPALLPQIGYYFTKNRGLMIGIASAGIGVSSFFIAPVTLGMIELFSWRATYFIWGVIILAVLGGVSFVFKNAGKHYLPPPPEQAGGPLPGLTFKEALRTANFYVFCIIFLIFGYNLHSIMIHIIPFGLDMGLGRHAIRVLVFIGAVSVITRVMAAWLSDRIGSKITLIIELILVLLAFVVLQFPVTLFRLYVFGAFFGLAYGGMSLAAIATGDYFGKRAGGTILGGIMSMYTVGGALGPLLTGFIFDFKNNYNLAFLICLILALLCVLLCFKLNKPRFTA